MRTKIVVGVAVAIVVVILGVLGAIDTGLIPGSLFRSDTSAEQSARYYPADVAAYAWVNLYAEGGQGEHRKDMWASLNEMPGFIGWTNDLMDMADDESGIDFERDVAPWIGPEVSGAIAGVDLQSGVIEAAVTVDVMDADAAADFLRKWTAYMEDSNGVDFDRGSEGDFRTWVDEDGSQAYALSDDLLVFATTEDMLEDVMWYAAEERSRTLADDENFIEARAALPSERFASFYVSTEDQGNVTSRLPLAFGMAVGVGASLIDRPEWTAGSIAFVERGLVVEMVTPRTSQDSLARVISTDVAELLPEDTLGLLALGFEPDLDNWRGVLAEYVITDDSFPGIADVIRDAAGDLDIEGIDWGRLTQADLLNLGLAYVRQATGIDLERDVFDHLSGDAIVALREFDIETLGGIDGFALLSYRPEGEKALEDTVEDIIGLAEPAFGEVPLSIPYMLNDGYLTIATTEEALDTIADLQSGQGGSLTSADEYQRTVGHLPSEQTMLAYVDLQSILRQFDMSGLTTSQRRAVRDIFSAVGVAATSDADFDRVTLVLTMFPGQ